MKNSRVTRALPGFGVGIVSVMADSPGLVLSRISSQQVAAVVAAVKGVGPGLPTEPSRPTDPSRVNPPGRHIQVETDARFGM